MRWLVPLAVAMLVPLLSGCTGAAGCANGSDGQTCVGEGVVAYNGASNGTQTSDPIECGTDGHLSWTSNIGGGSVTFTVKDNVGVVQFTKTLSGPGQSADEKPIQGVAGDWVLVAARSGGLTGSFSGQYTANIHC